MYSAKLIRRDWSIVVDPPILFEQESVIFFANSPARRTSSAEFIIAAAHGPPSPGEVRKNTNQELS